MSNFLPNELLEKLKLQEGFDVDAFKAVHQVGERITSIRLNPKKITEPSYSNVSPVPWCEWGYYLSERPVFTVDPLYHAGCYYVQEASSMFIAHILKEIGLVNSPVRALDLCAAPGGKTTLLSSYLHHDSLLVANEVIKARVNILQDNVTRWGEPIAVVTNNDPSAFAKLPGYFDLTLVDAPCSGSGMFRKDEGAVDEWSQANVNLCSDRQKRILAESVVCLKEGGYLFYSTCSYSEQENEDILDWLISEYGFQTVQVNIDPHWGVEESISKRHSAFGYRFYPHKVKGEGFFIGVLKKKSAQHTFERRKTKPEKSAISNEELAQWVSVPQDLTTFLHGEDVHIFPKLYTDDLKWLQNVLYIREAGINIGRWTGRELIPSHDLALSFYINTSINKVELSLETALKYLRKEALMTTEFQAARKGWCLVQYKGVNLGWVKVLGNRINNYYPKSGRIMHL